MEFFSPYLTLADEPTAAFDLKAEYEIYTGFDKIIAGQKSSVPWTLLFCCPQKNGIPIIASSVFGVYSGRHWETFHNIFGRSG